MGSLFLRNPLSRILCTSNNETTSIHMLHPQKKNRHTKKRNWWQLKRFMCICVKSTIQARKIFHDARLNYRGCDEDKVVYFWNIFFCKTEGRKTIFVYLLSSRQHGACQVFFFFVSKPASWGNSFMCVYVYLRERSIEAATLKMLFMLHESKNVSCIRLLLLYTAHVWVSSLCWLFTTSFRRNVLECGTVSLLTNTCNVSICFVLETKLRQEVPPLA